MSMVEGESTPLEQLKQLIVDELSTLPGIRHAPNQPTEQLNNFPALLVYSDSGTYKLETHSGSPRRRGTFSGQHIIRVELHVERRNLPDDVARADPYGDLIATALIERFAEDGFNGLITRLIEIRYNFRALDWGDSETMGWRFQLEVTIDEEIIRGTSSS